MINIYKFHHCPVPITPSDTGIRTHIEYTSVDFVSLHVFYFVVHILLHVVIFLYGPYSGGVGICIKSVVILNVITCM